jgi:hypothetical protein
MMAKRSMVPQCSVSALKVRDWLRAQIKDEAMAQRDYRDAGQKMSYVESEIGYSGKPHLDLYDIADQEKQHGKTLREMVDQIDKKCGGK